MVKRIRLLQMIYLLIDYFSWIQLGLDFWVSLKSNETYNNPRKQQ